MDDKEFASSFLDGLTARCMKQARQTPSNNPDKIQQDVKRLACLSFCNTTNGECDNNGKCRCKRGENFDYAIETEI